MIVGERTHVRNTLKGERTMCERTDANKWRGRTDLLPTSCIHISYTLSIDHLSAVCL